MVGRSQLNRRREDTQLVKGFITTLQQTKFCPQTLTFHYLIASKETQPLSSILMDLNLELYKSLLGLDPLERHERLLHLPRSERSRVASIVGREELNQRLQEELAGRNLIEIALSNPSEFHGSVLLQNALLGRTSYTVDETKMVKRIMGAHIYNGEGLFEAIANFDRASYFAIPIDAWKLVYCDLYYIDGDNSCSLQDIYERRLREEELQTAAAQARENIRRGVIKLARRNAKWMLSELDRLSDEEKAQPLENFEKTVRATWRQASHTPPAWIQDIFRVQQPWGFVYYKTKEVQHPCKWSSLLDMVNNTPQPSLARDVSEATYFGIHCQGKRNDLVALQTEVWAPVTSEGDLDEDDGFRRHFQEYRQSLSSPGILQNTFIVIPNELVPESRNGELDPYCVWAYDADWDKSTEETVCSNGEKYQGRLEIAVYSINAWFYAARWEGVSLRDMWLKAQMHEDKQWICYSQEMDNWDHEPYV
ncbi:hypothetical protein FNAPI_9887 [Fusarium napiforme]|uniref:Uncharacterized protein n=1 Tax=Fusarium napiforme TaxID=42672 RepID=A0A8H5ISZ8_9HYPO|nr:hypothetical protein FNAPI_9887 [Fusarium napiforme]